MKSNAQNSLNRKRQERADRSIRQAGPKNRQSGETGIKRMEQETILEIQDLKKSFGKTEVLKGVSMRVYRNEIISVLGPSGCGKSTLLNIIAGMLAPDAGRVLLKGMEISGAGVMLPPEKRSMNMVFQDFALWPHMNAFENIAYGLRRRKKKEDMIRAEVGKMLELLHMEGLENRYPAELSGGQQQRVAIARALVTKPDILLMDEPLCNLDVQLRVEMRTELAFLFRRLGTTVFHVTHDPSEAFAMADRIVIMNHGNIDQIDTPQNCYRSPATESAAALLGAGNRLHGWLEEENAGRIRLRGETSDAHGENGKLTPVILRFRAESAIWAGSGQAENSFPVTVEYASFEGDYFRVMAKTKAGETVCFLNKEGLSKGATGFVKVDRAHLYIYREGAAA